MVRWTRLAAMLAIVIAHAGACGYRPVARAPGPASDRLHLAAPDVARIDEPALATVLHRALAAELGRRGVRLVGGAAVAPVLRTRALALSRGDAALGADAVSAVELSLELECRLVDPTGKTTWHSGVIEVREVWALSQQTLQSEHTRRVAVDRLARRAAVEIAQRLGTR